MRVSKHQTMRVSKHHGWQKRLQAIGSKLCAQKEHHQTRLEFTPVHSRYR